jgi:hypothetical protein
MPKVAPRPLSLLPGRCLLTHEVSKIAICELSHATPSRYASTKDSFNTSKYERKILTPKVLCCGTSGIQAQFGHHHSNYQPALFRASMKRMNSYSTRYGYTGRMIGFCNSSRQTIPCAVYVLPFAPHRVRVRSVEIYRRAVCPWLCRLLGGSVTRCLDGSVARWLGSSVAR